MSVKILCLECGGPLEFFTDEEDVYDVAICIQCKDDVEAEAKALGYMEGINDRGQEGYDDRD